VALQVMFVTGVSLMLARIGAKARDLSQLLPFFTRTWRYMSGVFFSITVFAEKIPSWGQAVLTYNPGAVFIDLVRDTMMRSHTMPPAIWLAGVLWAVTTFGLGLRYFYRGERRYV
jgi:teichoic acid transport system permease protein